MMAQVTKILGRRSAKCVLYNSKFLRNLYSSEQSVTTASNNQRIPVPAATSCRFSSTQFSNVPSLKCWKCGIERKHIVELFCEKCRSIQGPGYADNYFRLFGLDEMFNVDQKVLRQKYREMQSVLHPDKFTNRSEEEKRISEDFSSLVNKAYSVLQSPLSRAIHLLNLHGDTIAEDQSVDDPDFLMEIMELNEEVESAKLPERLKELEKKNRLMLDTLSGNIENCFKVGDIQGAKNQIVKMKYYASIHSHISTLLRERGIVD